MPENADIKWYVVHTYSGYENKVRDSLLKAVENNGMQDKIVDVRIPVEEAIEIKNNKRRTVQRKLLPSYVIVKMEMTNETWYVVRNTRGVTGFVGSGNKPTPLSETDFAAIFDAIPQTRLDIAVGDEVRILAGLFENFTGKVTAIDSITHQLSVAVSMGMCDTTVELQYDEAVRVE